MRDRSVAILVATFRRPAGLARLLDALADVVADAPPGWCVRVIACDNDPDGSARPTCDAHAGFVTYVHEPRPGIAAARNALVDAAPEADVVVFIDDDEWPADGWLAALLDAAERFDADVVAGPVVPEFEDPPAPELVPSFERGRRPTGAAVAWPSTANVLIRRGALESPPLRFRDEYGLSGGSDSMLFLELFGRGGRAVWADDAVVHELVPPDRANLRWVLRRSFRLGNTHTRFDRDLDGSLRVMATRGAKAIGWMATGASVVAVATLRRDRRARVRGLERIWRGAGMLAGFRAAHIEYRR